MNNKILTNLQRIFLILGAINLFGQLSKVAMIIFKYIKYNSNDLVLFEPKPTFLTVLQSISWALTYCAFLFLMASIFEALNSSKKSDQSISLKFCYGFAAGLLGIGLTNIGYSISNMNNYFAQGKILNIFLEGLIIFFDHSIYFIVAYVVIQLHKSYFYLINFEKDVI